MMPEVEVSDLSTALRSIQHRQFLASQKYQEQQTRADRVGAHPRMLEFSDKLIKVLAKEHGVPMFSHCIVRSVEDQKAAWVKGVSKTLKGAHLTGCASDIVHSIMAWDIDPKAWELLGHVRHEVAGSLGTKVVWGGPDFPKDTFDWDPAHWELVDYREEVVHGYVRQEGAWVLQEQAGPARAADRGAGGRQQVTGADTGVSRGGGNTPETPARRKTKTVADFVSEWLSKR